MSMCRWQVRFHVGKERALCVCVFSGVASHNPLLTQEAHWEAKQKSTLIFTLGRKGPTKLLENLEGNRS